VSSFLPYGRQDIDAGDLAAVAEALQSDYLTTGPLVGAFEAAFAQTVGHIEPILKERVIDRDVTAGEKSKSDLRLRAEKSFAEHIGALKIPWPSEQELDLAIHQTQDHSQFWEPSEATDSGIPLRLKSTTCQPDVERRDEPETQPVGAAESDPFTQRVAECVGRYEDPFVACDSIPAKRGKLLHEGVHNQTPALLPRNSFWMPGDDIARRTRLAWWLTLVILAGRPRTVCFV